MRPAKNKTIYFLGAGFSFPAGAPTQSQLTKEIFNFDIEHFIAEHGHHYPDPTKIKDLSPVKMFIENDFLLKLDNADLEDIYTPIDRCIIEGTSFKGKTPRQLSDLRVKLNAIISLIMDSKLRYPVADAYITKLATHIVKSNKTTDKSVVMTSNWDILLDNSITDIIQGTGDVVDYCCHFTNSNDGAPFPPPLVAKTRGHQNHKIIKLHGSLNWLWCSNCGRILVKHGEKIALRSYLGQATCRFCETETLTPQILMPTFLKDTSNTQLKNVWSQAGIELTEAKKIVFMGYSFPLADFEIRQLFARFVKPETQIEVVLNDKSDRKKYVDINENLLPGILWNLASDRYKRFFAKNQPTFCYDGVEKYIDDNFSEVQE
ncbi:MAG: hypothetical protein HON27_02710 [Candidatus Marinimicrobia bacterium]|jgi:hypothetical protein|nr:hypothetical protein [Candidatus Neomarinimicrobiota bacterium]MBT4945059.1 hypothetical protein [Candidatus Neomarinimicrobiota bacterium]MBT5269981.1 hypothetical protein [Candidatus Neomarinimicrobiota bacterium]